MDQRNADKGERYRDIDTWGYVVCFGTIITFVAGIGHINSFGLIYKDFIIDTNSSAKSLTTAHGVFAVMLAIGGLILNIISKRCSLRLGGLLGASLMTIGSVSTIFITNTNQLPFTFGLCQGIGFGMMVPVCYSTHNHYFNRKRTQAMSLIKAIQGCILIWYPQLVKLILSLYGFRATLWIISAISLHSFPGMIAMRTNFGAKKKPDQVATCISFSAGADVVGRFGLVLISSFFTINTRLLFYAATFLTLIARIVILQVRKFTWVVSVTIILGVLRAWLHVSSPLVISDHVSHQDFTGAYALFMLAAGIVNVVISPIIGLIKDLHQDYVPAFYALTVCCLPCLIFWPIEYYIAKRRNNGTTSEQNQSI